MLEVCFLGTGAMMPLPGRNLAALLVRRKGRLLLIDCGEGTQVAVRQSGWSLARIDAICLTHFHADHVAGLPGLLLTMGTCGRQAPVTILGPAGLEAVVACLRVIAPELAFPLRFEEMGETTHETTFEDVKLTAFALGHVIPCYGYAFSLSRPGKFDVARARALAIPVTHWQALQQGQTVTVDGRAIAPDRVMGAPRKGLKLVYCTDTRALDSIPQHAQGADLLICEGTYGELEKAEKANRHGHMTFAQAAGMATQAQVGQLLLTHFSPAMEDPAAYLPIAQGVFPQTQVATDLSFVTLRFEEAEG